MDFTFIEVEAYVSLSPEAKRELGRLRRQAIPFSLYQVSVRGRGCGCLLHYIQSGTVMLSPLAYRTPGEAVQFVTRFVKIRLKDDTAVAIVISGPIEQHRVTVLSLFDRHGFDVLLIKGGDDGQTSITFARTFPEHLPVLLNLIEDTIIPSVVSHP